MGDRLSFSPSAQTPVLPPVVAKDAVEHKSLWLLFALTVPVHLKSVQKNPGSAPSPPNRTWGIVPGASVGQSLDGSGRVHRSLMLGFFLC